MKIIYPEIKKVSVGIYEIGPLLVYLPEVLKGPTQQDQRTKYINGVYHDFILNKFIRRKKR